MKPQQYLRNKKSDAAALLSELVRIATPNPPGTNYRTMMNCLQKHCRRVGLSARVLPVKVGPDDVPPAYTLEELRKHPRFNLLARWETGAKKTLHFNSHYDVVPATPAGWKSNPFEPVVRGGKLYGRGSHDMKDAIVATLLAVESLQACGLKPACNLEISFTADEETGSHLGIAELVRSGQLKADAAIVGEGGSGLQVGIGHRGVIWWEITILGRSAHGSTPHLGSNAFEIGCEVAASLRNLEETTRKKIKPYRQGNGNLVQPTFMLGGEAAGGAGGKVNVVPNEFRFTLDRRLLPGENAAAAEKVMEKLVAKIVARHGGEGFRIRQLFLAEPCLTSPNDPFVKRVFRAVEEVRTTKADPTAKPTAFLGLGFTDLHQLKQLGIPVVGYGPQGERIHGANECSDLRSILQTASIYASLMQEGI